MKKILLIVFLIPFICQAQSYREEYLCENRIDEYTHDSIMRTNWFVLARGVIGDQFNLFFRISSINGEYFLDLKAMDAGYLIVVARNAPLDLLLEGDIKIRLYNSSYQASCTGCGARGYNGSDAHGITLSYPVPKADMEKLQYYYLDKVKLYCANGYWLKKVNDNNSELFMSQVNLIYNSGIRFK